MTSNLTALVDADNFYVSCERIFRPELRHRPVVVLSNNDSCVVARSREVKELGVKMGTPLYQIRDLVRSEKIVVFSSNYELYGDISARVMNILSRFSGNLETYSIDEAFIQLPPEKADTLCEQIIQTCRDWISIPVKIGVAPTKTLSKAAAELVKQENPSLRYKILLNQKEIDSALTRIPLEDVWGIGQKTVEKLKQHGITTPLQLKYMPEQHIRKHFNITLLRTVTELGGKTCFELENQPSPQKNLCHSKSFGRSISKYQDLREAVVSYATEAAAKLRRRKLIAPSVSVFILTSRFNQPINHYANSACLPLTPPSNDTPAIVKSATKGLERIYKSGYMYKKCGILLNDLIPEAELQPDMFVPQDPRDKAISEAMDTINSLYGPDSISLAAAGSRQPKWKMSRKYQSARYTTQWNDILTVR
ncbi:MAG: Y-family DNA polymerase [Verrucomicrobiota bacterium]